MVRVDRPGDEPLLVSLCRLRRCPTEIGTGEFWPPDGRKGKRKRVEGVSDRHPSQSATTVPSSGDAQGAAPGVVGNEMLGDIEQATTTISDGVGDTPPGVTRAERPSPRVLDPTSVGASGGRKSRGETTGTPVPTSSEETRPHDGGRDGRSAQETTQRATEVEKRLGRWAGRLRHGPGKPAEDG